MSSNVPLPPSIDLTDEERAIYEWQIWLRELGEAGQRRLKGATALVSRVGGLGGSVALQLAAAGVGRLILAHAGNLKPSDLNRQTLMTHDWLGKPRVESANRRLLELNPRLEIIAIPENITDANADRLVRDAGIAFDCAPLFEERLAMNRACVKHNIPMIESAVYAMEGQITTIVPGQTACLACRYPQQPAEWKRQFPILGAVAATAGSIAALEGIKLMAGLAPSLAGTLLTFDLGSMAFRRLNLRRDPRCAVCGSNADAQRGS